MSDNAAVRAQAPAWLARLLARRRQMLGRYDATTAGWYRTAWERGGRPVNLLEWVAFGRELGRLPDAGQVDLLRGLLADRRGRLDRRLAELLIEAGALTGDEDPGLLPGLVSDAERSPPLARWLGEAGVALGQRVPRLGEFDALQPDWRQAFGDDLAAAPDRICVVGNAATLTGAGLGPRIDAHRVVSRFNRWSSASSSNADLGERADVWVCAPRFLAEITELPAKLPRWVVITGPDARYGRAGRPVDWGRVLALLDAGVKVVTVPLSVWADLVDRLAAPPSAGVLFLAWAAELAGGFGHLAIAGFDSAAGGARAYHHAGTHLRPGRRHAWEAERRLLRDWCVHGGLSRLDETA